MSDTLRQYRDCILGPNMPYAIDHREFGVVALRGDTLDQISMHLTKFELGM